MNTMHSEKGSSRSPLGRFQKPYRANFRQADPAGILFFAQAFNIAHDVYESFIEHLGFSYKEWFDNGNWGVPIRHSEANHLKPLRPGEVYDVQVQVDRIGTSSVTLLYVIMKAGQIHCETRLVHTFYDIHRGSKCDIPSNVRETLARYQSACLGA